jgi:RNA polymerase sigma-70 factor (ECF subfamily)
MNDYIDRTITGSSDIARDNRDDLIAACVAGDRRSQRAFFNERKRSVYNLCYRLLGPGFDLDDVVQQVFIQLFHSLKSFKGLSSIDTWTYRITSKVCTDQLRKKYRKRQLEILDDSDELAADGKMVRSYDPYERLEQRELALTIYHALNKLSFEKRVVIVLYEMEKKSLEEIAATIDAPMGTVKSRLFHARKELGKHLKKYMEP